MEAAPAPHAQPERHHLRPVDVDARRAVAALAGDPVGGEHVDHRAFDAADQVAHADAEPAQVHQRVGHQLAGAVVRHLPAAVDLHDRDVARRQHVLRLAGLAEREHRIMLDEPQFVGGVLAACIGELLHRAPDRLVRLPAQIADLPPAGGHDGCGRIARRGGRGRRRVYSVHLTAGCSRRAPCAAS